MKKALSKVFIAVITLTLIAGIFVFCHSIPERSIKTHLAFHGYPVAGFKTHVYESRMDKQYGQLYSCKSPAIGADFYSCKKGFLGLWFVDTEHSGGG